MAENSDFNKHAEQALTLLHRELAGAADDYGFSVEHRAGSITVGFRRPPGQLIISSQPAVEQVWIAAPSRSYKLDWDIVENTFIHGDTRLNVKQLVEQALSRQLKQDVEL